ncbi:MAG: glycosyltransferase family 2 protein [Parcubacteria group bacterium]
MKLSVIIPAYNEQNTILEIIRRVKNVELPLEKEIIVVDNDSQDSTYEMIRGLDGIKVFIEKERGKGAAVKRGIKESTGDIVIIQDADLEYDPRDFSAMIRPILEGKTEVTNGVRKENKFREENDFYFGVVAWFGNSVITWVTNILYLNNAGEYEGCYKAFTKKIIDSISVNSNNFNFENELFCKILKRGYSIVDVPISYKPRSYADGKKINWRHGFLILWTVIKYRFID